MSTTTSRSRRRAKPSDAEEEPTNAIAPLPAAVAAAIVFVAAGSVLVLEILSVRLLAPYVGLTLETTTSIIGAVLLGIAVGAGAGGWIADRTSPPRLLVGLLIGGSLLALLTVPIVRWLGPSADEGGTAGALKVTFAALVPVAAVLSAISPTVAHWQLRDLRASGTIIGGLSAWATAGALVGTFGTGFVLVPLLSVSTSVLAVGIALAVAGILLGAYTHLFRAGAVVSTILAAAAIGAIGPSLQSPCDAETSYHCIKVTLASSPAAGRYLFLDREANSFVDLDDARDLGTFQYVRWIADTIKTVSTPKAPLQAVFVGGGGFTLPRWLEAARPGSRSNVLEVDKQLVEFDEHHLGLQTSTGVHATIGDARLTMRRERSRSADVVVGDAFSGLTVPWQLMTTAWLREVRRVLKPGGIYALNIIDLPPLALLRAEAASLLEVFGNLRMITMATKDGQPTGGNAVLIASDAPLPPQLGPPAAGATLFARAAIVRLAAGAKALTDDYAPVDQLQTRSATG
ncbi:MAG TPA: fused MFS/spermidine synthase [Solirubrobacteraceae bacterium]|jgi:spermidine synthase